jgi:hypothetical protein
MARVSIERSARRRAPNNVFRTIFRLRTIARFVMAWSLAFLRSGGLIEKINQPINGNDDARLLTWQLRVGNFQNVMMNRLVLQLLAFLVLMLMSLNTSAGVWVDSFSETTLGREWTGNTNFFTLKNGILKGVSMSPLAPAPFNLVEVGDGWSNYVVECMIDVVTPNWAVCTKGALVLRHRGSDGYVFALHQPTQTIEVYRLLGQELLLSNLSARQTAFMLTQIGQSRAIQE